MSADRGNDNEWDETCLIILKQTRKGRLQGHDPQTMLKCLQLYQLPNSNVRN